MGSIATACKDSFIESMSIQLEPTRVQADRPCHRGIHTLTGIQVLAIDAYAPAEVVDNRDLSALGYDAQWILQRTGIRQRRRAPATMATSDMAYEAARRCLDKAGVDASELDLICVATMTPDTLTPATACHVQRRLGSRAAAMDISAACSGFIFALATAAQFVKTGFSKRALVVGADVMTRIVDPEDKKTFPLFGDGGGAALVAPGREDQGLLAYTLGTDGHGAGLLCIPAGGTREPFSAAALASKRYFLQMDGRSVFKWAVRTVADTIREVVAATRLTLTEIPLFVLHQANLRILLAVADDLGISPDRLLTNVDRYGNTSAGSIPLALAEAESQGRLQRGDLVVICGFGAGLTWGTAVMRW
jgi:3-oxoacyl-[acyl-carrier-protein] synthase-3